MTQTQLDIELILIVHKQFIFSFQFTEDDNIVVQV